MPIPCYVNVDLREQWKLGLNVARTDYNYRDPRFLRFKNKFYTLSAKLIKQILKKKKLLPKNTENNDFVDTLFHRSDPLLRKKLNIELNYWPKKSGDEDVNDTEIKI